MPGKKRHVAPNFSQLKVSSVKARARGLHIKMEGCQRTGYFAELTRQNKSKGRGSREDRRQAWELLSW